MCVSSLKITAPELIKAWNSFDSAWNPLADPQAQDYAHRIGQTHAVPAAVSTKSY